jgi:hypothetical protein
MWSRSVFMKTRLIRFSLSSSPSKLAVLIAVTGHGRISIEASTDSSSGLCWDNLSLWNSGLRAAVVGGSSAPVPNIKLISFSGNVGKPC